MNGSALGLIDAYSASCSDLFALLTRDTRQAVIMGSKTVAQTLSSHFISLPKRYSLQVPLQEHVSLAGQQFDGSIIVPDIEFPIEHTASDRLMYASVIEEVASRKQDQLDGM